MKQISYILIVISFLLSSSDIISQSNKVFIYGKAYTNSGEKFTGFIKWGSEEVLWNDVFNSQKKGNQYIKSPEKAKKSGWSDFDWSFSSLWEDKYKTSTHLFSCFYGDIATLHMLSSSKVKLILKNGAEIELQGGSNDIGASINMYDYELGKVKLSWNKVDRIEFQEVPDHIEYPQGEALYGTVSTRRNKISGYIKWDLDERLTSDIMDGESRHGDQEIPFKNIKEIEKLDEGVLVTFKSGRTMEIDGTNDCDSGNRGIAIYQDGIGSMEISWKYFNHIVFEDPPANPRGYNDYDYPTGLDATVHTFNGLTYDGLIVFDMDEMWEIEILDGDDDHIEYQIPFRNIKSIVPKNQSYSMITLRNGEKMLLGERQDVSRRNDGIIVFTKSKEDPIFVKWDDVDEIILK